MRDLPREGTIFLWPVMSKIGARSCLKAIDSYSNTLNVVPFNEVLKIFKGLLVMVFKGVPV